MCHLRCTRSGGNCNIAGNTVETVCKINCELAAAIAQHLFSALEEMSSDPSFRTKSSVAVFQAALTLRVWCQDVQNGAALDNFSELLIT